MSCVEKAIIDSHEHRETASNRIGYIGTLSSNLQNALLPAAQRESIQHVGLVPSMLC